MMIGIDLGTTNSLVAYIKDGKSETIENALGKHSTPSVVGLSDDNEVIIGEAARQRLSTHPDKTVAAFKRYMGTGREIKLGKQVYRAEELSALVLKSLKSDAEAFLEEKVTQAVISVPAYFNDAQRKATKAASELAGFERVRLINEPTAAAIAYGLHKEVEESTFMVFDLGGGTFDISILELFDGVMQVHACAGDNHLGGEDFTKLLLQHFLDQHSLNFKKIKPSQQATLLRLAENAKVTLSSGQDIVMKFEAKRKEYESTITALEFEKISEPLMNRLREPMIKALKDAQMNASELDSIVMVGGACRMPMIRKNVSRMLSQLPHSSIDYDKTVSLGAAVQAGLITEDATLNEIVLTDVMPYSLGVGVTNPNSSHKNDNLFSPVLERNSAVPISRVADYYPNNENQTKVDLGIYQGESRYVRDNVNLGLVSMPIKPGPTHLNRLDVRFTFDLNGILEVEVHKSDEVKRLVIEGNPGVLTQEEIDQSFKKLAALKMHPREKTENITTLNRATRLYEQNLGDSRDYLNQLITQFESVLLTQDDEKIAEVRQGIEAQLDEIDDDPLT